MDIKVVLWCMGDKEVVVELHLNEIKNLNKNGTTTGRNLLSLRVILY